RIRVRAARKRDRGEPHPARKRGGGANRADARGLRGDRRGSGSAMMERIDSTTIWEGAVARVRIDEFRYPDGSTSRREIVGHPGAVAIVAHDERSLYLVRQP